MRRVLIVFVLVGMVADVVLLMVSQDAWKLAILYTLLVALAVIVRDVFRGPRDLGLPDKGGPQAPIS